MDTIRAVPMKLSDLVTVHSMFQLLYALFTGSVREATIVTLQLIRGAGRRVESYIQRFEKPTKQTEHDLRRFQARHLARRNIFTLS